MSKKPKIESILEYARRFRKPLAAGAVLLFLVSVVVFALVVTGATRKDSAPAPTEPNESGNATTTREVARRLDGAMVEPGREELAPYAVMIENHPDARPLSGISKARVVIEAPVEGGITRFLAFFDRDSEIEAIGPVRSARAYYVEWANGWNGSYFHVGGSPDSLELIRALDDFTDVNEFANGASFWRNSRRYAPHNAYTSSELMAEAVERKEAASTTMQVAWHFQDAATSTERGGVSAVRIPYGGTYNVSWNYDAENGVYRRSQAGRLQQDADGSQVEAENVIVIKTDATVVDAVGRLDLRTVGSGEAVAYRDGNKYTIRWSRSPGEPIRFETDSGAEFLLTRGRTWIQVTTSDLVFAGVSE